MAPILCGFIFFGIVGMVIFDFITSKKNEKEENRVRERVKNWLFRIGVVLTLLGTYLWDWTCLPNLGWTCFNGIAFLLPISLPGLQAIEVDASVLITVLLALVFLFRISPFKYSKHVAFFGVFCLIAVSTYSEIYIRRITQESDGGLVGGGAPIVILVGAMFMAGVLLWEILSLRTRLSDRSESTWLNRDELSNS